MGLSIDWLDSATTETTYTAGKRAAITMGHLPSEDCFGSTEVRERSRSGRYRRTEELTRRAPDRSERERAHRMAGKRLTGSQSFFVGNVFGAPHRVSQTPRSPWHQSAMEGQHEEHAHRQQHLGAAGAHAHRLSDGTLFRSGLKVRLKGSGGICIDWAAASGAAADSARTRPARTIVRDEWATR